MLLDAIRSDGGKMSTFLTPRYSMCRPLSAPTLDSNLHIKKSLTGGATPPPHVQREIANERFTVAINRNQQILLSRNGFSQARVNAW